MPGNWDGKSRPSNKQYRENFDDIFKRKRVRMARSKAVKFSSEPRQLGKVKGGQGDKTHSTAFNE